MLCFLLIAGYATLPWWLPTSVIRSAVADDIASQTGLTVNVGPVSVNWSEGVVINKIQISSPASQGGETICTVESAKADFSPLKFLFAGHIGWLELEKPRVAVKIDHSGDVNISPLTRIQPKVQVDRISIRQASTSVKFPGQERQLRLNVGDMQILGGRADRIGKVTMSAELEQPDQPAPISLNVAPGSSEYATAAEASFRFANIDIGQFNLPNLLHLSLERFDGRCGGTIKLKLNQQAQVDQVDMSLVLNNILVRVCNEPPAPAIERIDLNVTAAFDPLTGWLDIRSATVKMPGLDLAGKFNAGTDLRRGPWEALESFNLAGTVEPEKLGWIAEQADIADIPFKINGPVGLAMQISHSGPSISIKVSVKADDAKIALRIAPDRPIKLPGERFSVDMEGSLDERMWDLAIDKNIIRIGQTVFEGKGTIKSVRKIVDVLSGEEDKPPPSLADVMDILARVTWHGSMKLENVRHILEVRPELASLDEILQLGKPIEGDLNFDGPAGRKFDASLSLDAKTGRGLDGEHVVLRGSGRIESDRNLLADGLVELAIGKTALGLRDLKVAIVGSADATGKASLRTSAIISCGDVASLVELLNARPSNRSGLPADVKICGALAGHLDVKLFGGRDSAILGLDLSNLDMAFGQGFVKPGGQKASLDFSLESANLAGGGALTANCDLDCRQSRLSVGVSAASLGELAEGRGEVKFKLASIDAGTLISACPMLSRQPTAMRLAGPFEFAGRAVLSSGSIRTEAILLVDGLSAEFGGGRVKRASSNLQAKFAATINVFKDQLALKDAKANLTLGNSRIYANVEFGEVSSGSGNLLERLRPIRFLDCGGSISPDEFLLGLLPEARRFVESFNLTAADAVKFGFILGRGASENETDLALRIDADNAAFSRSQMTFGELGLLGDPLCLLRVGPVHKVPGQTARAGVFLALKTDPTAELKTRSIAEIAVGLDFRLAGARCAMDSYFTAPGYESTAFPASARSKSATTPSARPAAWSFKIAGEKFEAGRISGRLELSGLQGLTGLFPRLGMASLAGGLRADWILDPAGTGTGNLDISFDRFGCQWSGKKVYLNGRLSVADVVLNSSAMPDDEGDSDGAALGWPGLVRTGGLEFGIGDNHGWIIAELAGWPDRVSGDVSAFLRKYDVQEVQDWASGAGPVDAAAQAAAKARLTFQQKQEILSQADKALQAARKYLSMSDLNVFIQAQNLVVFDPEVERSYEWRNFVARITAKQGQIRLASDCGLNGGCDKLLIETKLTDADPIMSSETILRDVTAAENIQPQLAKFFPGNIIQGSFDRSEKVTYHLRDIIAQTIDVRVHAIPTGHSKMLARDGYVLGRAAPQFVANIFPGLNLTKYEYKTMTSFGEFHPDGTARNDMIFSGQSYDMYMEGTTDVNNFAEYEIGLILLGQDADWNHSWKQLRIPILKFKGTIEGGKILNQEVSYFWPTETAFVIFLKNNIVYRLWANIANPGEGKK